MRMGLCPSRFEGGLLTVGQQLVEVVSQSVCWRSTALNPL